MCSYSKLYQVEISKQTAAKYTFQGPVSIRSYHRESPSCSAAISLQCSFPHRQGFIYFIFQIALLVSALYLPSYCSPCAAITVSGHPPGTGVINKAFHTQVTSGQIPKKTQLQTRCCHGKVGDAQAEAPASSYLWQSETVPQELMLPAHRKNNKKG